MVRKILNKRWLQHLVFWVLSIYLIAAYFSISNYLQWIDGVYSLFFHIPLFIMVYLNVNWLIPRFFSYPKLYLFILLNVANVGLATLIHQFIFDVGIPMLPIEFYIVSFTDLNILLGIFGGYAIISTLLKLSKSWFQLEQAEKENTELELNALQTQVNPHFLFNTLNSIYSLSLSKSPKTPDIVLKLSELLRYMLYEVSEEKVSLRNEINVMKGYLDLQRLRLDETTTIEFNIELHEEGDILVPPLLFFPLIENSFKHGLKGTSKNGFVRIDLVVRDGQLSFEIENNKGLVDETEEKRYHGIGLENVRKRILFIYGEEAKFEVKDQSASFLVSLNFNY